MQDWSEDDVCWLAGSRGLKLQVCRSAVIYLAEPRWRTFLTVVEDRSFTRKVCHGFAKVFGGEQVIYVPDSGYGESEAVTIVQNGASVEEARGWLVRTCGPQLNDWDRHEVTDDDAAANPAYRIDRVDGTEGRRRGSNTRC